LVTLAAEQRDGQRDGTTGGRDHRDVEGLEERGPDPREVAPLRVEEPADDLEPARGLFGEQRARLKSTPKRLEAAHHVIARKTVPATHTVQLTGGFVGRRSARVVPADTLTPGRLQPRRPLSSWTREGPVSMTSSAVRLRP
jgi:hypothetical protein